MKVIVATIMLVTWSLLMRTACAYFAVLHIANYVTTKNPYEIWKAVFWIVGLSLQGK